MFAASIPAEPVQLERVERLEDVREDWIRLAGATGIPFASYEWNAGWWRAFGAGRELYTFAWRGAGGELAGVLPLFVSTTRPARVARFLGHGDLQSPVCAPEQRAAAALAMREATRVRGGCRLLVAERLPREAGWGDVVEGPLLSTHHDPVLRFDGATWEEYLASRSKNFREQVRRRERKLVREHDLSFRLADDPARLPDDMEVLFRLHGERWGEQSTGVFAGAGAEFHRELAPVALRAGWLRLWLAEIGGEPVAAWYGFRFGGDEWYYQAGRERRFDDLSLGFVMLTHTMREACGEGARAYHFLAGAEEYKSRFTQEDPGAESRLIASRPLAAAGRLALSLGYALPASARRRVMGMAGRGGARSTESDT